MTVVQETKEYSDASAQHDIADHTSSILVQTDVPPQRSLASSETQTEADKAPLPQGVDEAVQASVPEASSSSAPIPVQPVPAESPPSYARLLEEEREKIGMAELAKWHPSGEPSDLQVSSDAVAEWHRVKAELGMSCLAIDHALENATVLGPRAEAEVPEVLAIKGPRRSLLSRDDFRFYFSVAVVVLGMFLLSSSKFTTFFYPLES